MINTINTITFIDVDETLFFTSAKIIVRDKFSKRIISKLTNKEYNSYVLSENEEFDFSQFVSAETFISSSKPNKPMINILQKLFEVSKSSNSEVYLLTARSDFDDKNKFLNFLIDNGIPVGHRNNNKIHVIRAGNMPGSDNAMKKYSIIKKMLQDKNKFTSVRLYDDAISNLKAFNDLKLDFPNINFQGYLIDGDTIDKF